MAHAIRLKQDSIAKNVQTQVWRRDWDYCTCLPAAKFWNVGLVYQ